MDFQPLTESIRCELGESPVYDDRRHFLWLADILGKALHRIDLATGATARWDFPVELCSFGLCESGRLVMALRDAIAIFDPEDANLRELCTIERDNPDTRLNDGKVGPDGAFWVGTADISSNPVKRPIGALYRIDRTGKAEKKIEGLIASNGLAFSPGGDFMFHSDSMGHWLDRWLLDSETGEISNRTRIAEVSDELGRPDGAATDVEGCYWSAGVSAARLNRFSPDGELLESLPVPLAAPTMPCFGGPDMKTLYLTSLRVGRSAELLAAYPLSGLTLFARSDVPGAPVSRFHDA